MMNPNQMPATKPAAMMPDESDSNKIYVGPDSFPDANDGDQVTAQIDGTYSKTDNSITVTAVDGAPVGAGQQENPDMANARSMLNSDLTA